MNPNIAIIIDYCAFFEDDNNKGGSETWAIEISKQFKNNGYNVFMFTLHNIWQISNLGIQYTPISKLKYMLGYIKFDYIFISRYIFNSTLKLFDDYPLHKNIYWVAHDFVINIDNKVFTYEEIQEGKYPILKEHLNKIICVSDFCKNRIQNSSHFPDEYFEVIGNGLNMEIFDNIEDIEPDNNLFWSSRYERGLSLVANDIIPKLKDEFPDIKVYTAQYENYLPDDLLNNENIIFLGQLNKEDLYKEMRKHKVMFYPNFYPETFCITAIESVMNNEELITAFAYGPACTFKNFKSAFIKFDTKYESEEDKQQIANEIKERIKNYNNKDRKIIRSIIKNYMKSEYSWENIFKQFKEKILK